MSKRSPSKGKKIKPKFWVFCEGETEETYVRFLRNSFRVPIEIKTKIAGTKINERLIKTTISEQPIHEKDKVFLMYDADIESTLGHLMKIPSVIALLSNPTIELWFLLHYKNQTAEISQNECIRQLSNRNNSQYKKGKIDRALLQKLTEKRNDACKRAKGLVYPNNPSTSLHNFIELLERIK